MDRVIQKKKFNTRKILFIVIPLFFIALTAFYFLSKGEGSKLNVEKERLTFATVSMGQFNEYIAVDGLVHPIRTIYLDAVEGGRIEEIYVEDGALVSEGQPILRLSNAQLELDMMNREELLFNEMAAYRNAIFSQEKNELVLAEQIAEAELNYNTARRKWQQDSLLFDKGHISQNDHKESKDNYQYRKYKLHILRQKEDQESRSDKWQVDQLASSVKLKEKNYRIVKDNYDKLTIKAPANGQLTAFSSEEGELKVKGENIGQIDVLDGFKIKASIDEHFLSKVAIGQSAAISFAGQEYELQVIKVYSQVKNGKFEADLEFSNAPPEGIKRGQSLQVKLQIGGNNKALLLPKGGFYQTTGGDWIYVVSASGAVAEKKYIRIGRQNPDHFEVLEGLQEGDKVITSSYSVYNNADKLIIN